MSAPKPLVGVAVDMAVFTVQHERLEILLLRMTSAPYTGKWALPGGRIASDETVERAAAREVADKTDLRGFWFEQVYTFSAPDRDARGRCVSVLHMTLIPPTSQLRTTDKYSAIGWFPISRLPPLAFDHRDMVALALANLRARLYASPVARELLPATFTLGELQRLYQAVLGKTVDPRNFQRRVRALGLVEETGRLRTGQRYRPARLYRFRRRSG
jgi:ADP-ribose pyrophosphatase YjhB (NUDIX family)